MAILLILLSLILFALLLVITLGAKTPERGVLMMLSLSLLYYGVLGPAYWAIEQDGVFLSVDWLSALPYTTFALVAGTVYWAICLTAFQGRDLNAENPINMGSPDATNRTGPGLLLRTSFTPTAKFFLVLGGIGGLYTLTSSFVSGNTHETGNAFFLIAYQFSDALIPALLFLFATSKNLKARFGIILLYMTFAVLVGFRYKMALFLGPVLLYVILSVPYRYQTGPARMSAYASLALVGLGIIGLFSLLTLIRQPFEGVDVGRLADSRADRDFMYGLFAEANTIFALAAIQEKFIPESNYYYLTPIIDALQELVPRFLYPTRVTGAYLADVLHGLLSTEAMTSGTAYPYLGEIFLMGGYIGAALLIPVLALWTSSCLKSVSRSHVDFNIKLMGYAIIGVYFGYYYFSRGYFAQSFKGFLFVALPYILICIRAAREMQSARRSINA